MGEEAIEEGLTLMRALPGTGGVEVGLPKDGLRDTTGGEETGLLMYKDADAGDVKDEELVLAENAGGRREEEEAKGGGSGVARAVPVDVFGGELWPVWTREDERPTAEFDDEANGEGVLEEEGYPPTAE
jgi:hypothetical protein